jgi:hypothetical protein
MDNAMPQPVGVRRLVIVFAALSALAVAGIPFPTGAQAADDAYRPPQNGYDSYTPPRDGGAGYEQDQAPPDAQPPYRPGGVYREDDNYRRNEGPDTAARRPDDGRGPGPGYGEPYHPPGEYDRGPPPDDRGPPPPYNSYSQNEIVAAGHRFFGSVSEGLASVVEYAFQKSGRPNGYILGEDAGGAFVAGLRYGEGTLYTKDAGVHKVYWQGPSIGYDFGGEGSKTMVLVYNLRDPRDIYERYAGVQGSAYIVGGVGIQFQAHGNVTLAPIRSGIGLRLGANVGYLKYTREPTWNPF